MAPSPGTPVGGERAARSPRRGAASNADGGQPTDMVVDAGSATAALRVYCPVPG